MNQVPATKPAPASSINCQDVAVRFDDGSVAVDQVDLEIVSGEIISLVGPSGCGKTTLLRAIAGLQEATRGKVVLSPPAQSSRGEIGFVFQQPSLLPWATTLQNVMLPLEIIDQGTRTSRIEAATQALESVKLAGDSHKFPHELSGGMQMRASIARALVTNPKILLLDEPFAALDDMLRNELGRLLLALWNEKRFTAVMVTHNISESIILSGRIAVMRNGLLESVIDNPMPWPRSPSQIRTPEFGHFYGVVSDLLRGRQPAATP